MPLRLPRTITSNLAKSTFRTYLQPLTRQTTRFYATPTSFPSSIPPELASKFQKCPKTLDQFTVVAELFENKGFSIDRQPTMTEMMKIGADSDIRRELIKLNGFMKEEGIAGDVMEVLKKLGK